MTTSPTPTPKPSAGGFDAAAIAKMLKDSATNSGNKSTRAGAYDNSTMINIAGIPLPSGAFPPGVTQMSAKDLSIAFEKMASGAVQSTSSQLDWETIKRLMADSGAYGSKPPSYKAGPITYADRLAINKFISTYAPSYSNPVAGQPTPSLWTLAGNAAQSAVANGAQATRLKIANVPVPNTLDLKSIADSAFRTALGRPPTAAESNKFASSYQQQVMAIGASNAINQAEVTQSNMQALYGTPSTPTTPTAGTMGAVQGPGLTGTTATPSPSLSDLKSIPTQTPQAPTPVVNFKQDAPSASVAATQFALHADPNAAGAHGLNEAMGAWFQSLKSGVSNGL